MKLKIITLFFSMMLLLSANLYAQLDTLNIFKQTDPIVELILKKDTKKLASLSSNSIYCSLCFKFEDNQPRNYLISKQTFFNKHFSDIFQKDLLDRLERKEKILFAEHSDQADYIVWYTIYRKDELTDGHEGGQIGIWFKKGKNGLLFSGVETMP